MITTEGFPDWEDTAPTYFPEDLEAKMDRLAHDKTRPFDIKYRPFDLSELEGQPSIRKTLQGFVREGRLNHMIFFGPRGVGKSSAAMALGHEFYGINYNTNFKVFSIPSSKKDLSFIHGEFQAFIKNGPKQAPFRIAFLDECEYLTYDAQLALKGIMENEKYKHVRIIMATNYPEKLLPQLVGENTLVFRFKPISSQIIQEYLARLSENEKINCEDDVLKLISQNCNGSLRKGVLHLESLSIENNNISLQDVKDRISYIEPSDIKELVRKAISGEDFEESLKKLQDHKGLPIQKILREVRNIIPDLEKDGRKLDPIEKRYILHQLGLYDIRISQSSDQMLQMICFLTDLADMP